MSKTVDDSSSGSEGVETDPRLLSSAPQASLARSLVSGEDAEIFRALADAMPHLAWMAEPDGTIFWYNQRWYDYTGTSPGEMKQKGWQSALEARDLPRVVTNFKAAITAGTCWEDAFNLRRHDGVLRWHVSHTEPLCNEAGEIVCWYGTNTDITEEHTELTSLRESEALLRDLLENAPVMIWIMDADGGCSYLSRTWYEFTGQTPESGLGSGWMEVLHPEDRLSMRNRFAEAVKEEKAFRVEYRLRRKSDGTYRWMMDSAVPRYGPDGTFQGFIGSVTDIADRKESEDLLRENKDELVSRVEARTAELRSLTLELTRAERRERKRLARILHDEIQQLLAAIKMHADVALRQEGNPEILKKVLKLSDDAISACRNLAVGLSPPVMYEADLAGALKWLGSHLEEQHGLEVTVSAGLLPTELPEEIRLLVFEITRELLFNVVKHSGVDQAEVRVGFENQSLWVEVEDKGKGCNEEALTRPGRESFGLFSIRERLAEFNGTMESHSRPGEGCRVRAVLPATLPKSIRLSKDTVPVIPLKSLPTQKRRGILRLLLAEDQQIMRQGLAEMLSSQQDIEVVAQAADEEEAVDLALHHKPDVVVIDINMIGTSQLDSTRIIREGLPRVRVVGLSMHDNAQDLPPAETIGADAVLSKDAPVSRLLALVRGNTV